MSSNQETFEDFPQDDALWAVKYLDQFQQPHTNTRSTAVKVMLQRLPPMNVQQLANLTVQDCQDILGKRHNEAAWPQFEFLEILVGSLPIVTVGFVFKNGVKVGELPRSRHVISLQQDETDSDEVEAGQEIAKPPNWGENIPHRALNSYEYAGIFDHTKRNIFFSKSRLVVIPRRSGKNKEIFVIPRMTIFKSFYAQHTEIAKAICAGPWSRALEQIICLSDLESGLKTESVNDGEQWNIVLRTLVPDDYAGLLAVLFFDEYARACAESIYTRSVQDRHGNPRSPWFASAQIPLQALQGRMDLAVKCLALKVRYYTDEAGKRCEIRKYLVTEICGSTWPKQYPPIGISRTNDGTTGTNSEAVSNPAPYPKRPKTKEGDPSTTVSQNNDANANTSTTQLKGSEWGWLDEGPITKKLQKTNSKKYEGKPRASEDDGNQVSPGAHTHEEDALPKAETKTLVRVPNARFEQIVQILEQLKQVGFISEIFEVAPRRAGQMSDRNGRQCWKFIDDESLKNGRGPRAGWRAIYQSPNSRRNANYRTALVLAIQINGASHYWIEIECRESDGFRSVLLSAVDGNTHIILEATLDVIAEAKGRLLKQRIDEFFTQESIQVETYRHHYDEDRKSLTLESVHKFLLMVTGADK